MEDGKPGSSFYEISEKNFLKEKFSETFFVIFELSGI